MSCWYYLRRKSWGSESWVYPNVGWRAQGWSRKIYSQPHNHLPEMIIEATKKNYFGLKHPTAKKIPEEWWSSPGWAGLGATRERGRCPCLWKGGGMRWYLRSCVIQANPWFCDRKTTLKIMFLLFSVWKFSFAVCSFRIDLRNYRKDSGWVGLLFFYCVSIFSLNFLWEVSVFVKNVKNSAFFNSTAFQNRLSSCIFPTFITEIFLKAIHWNLSKSRREKHFKTNHNYLLQPMLFKKKSYKTESTAMFPVSEFSAWINLSSFTLR